MMWTVPFRKKQDSMEQPAGALEAELEEARARLKLLEQEKADLEQKLFSAGCDQRDLFFERLLRGGHFKSLTDILDDGARVQVSFPNPYFLVLNARLETWGKELAGGLDIKDIYFILRNAMEHGFPGVTNAAEMNGAMIAILNLSQMPETGIRGIVQDARSLLEILEQQFGLEITISISRVYRSPMELPQALHDADLVLEYLELFGEDRPITAYEQLSMEYIDPSGTAYVELESRLLGCVRGKDFSGMRLVMHELISNEFSDTKPTVDIFRFRVYGVVNTLLYLMNDIRKLYGNEIVNSMNPGPRLTEARTLGEIVEAMDDMLDALERFADEKKQQPSAPWVSGVYSFVEEHYSNPDLTVAYISDQFHFTPTYCSKIFKDQCGIRLFDFIQQKRLERAKELLTTGKTFAEIAQESGFSSSLTMSRAFKRYEGAAPSVIREQALSYGQQIGPENRGETPKNENDSPA